MYWGLLFLFTTLSSFLFINFLGIYGVFCINFIPLFFLWLNFLLLIPYIFNDNIYFFMSLGKWFFTTSQSYISLDFLIDSTTISFSFLTSSIAIFVYIYTYSYFRYEPLVERLLLFLNMFIISMIFLVSSGNLICLFLGWEMIGLTSFLLINFWSTRSGTFKSAFKAYSFNKLSDAFLLFGILTIYNLFYSVDILIINTQVILYENFFLNFFIFKVNYIDLISFFFLGCAFIKSAQIGFHIWLPDSMEAPVPASALIHSATLVSAGIYLLLRLNNIFELSQISINIIAIIGSITAFYGGFVSMLQSDTKKILAFSTISHCGFLMVTFSTGLYEYTLLYLYIHGFFKAATFLNVGNIIRFSRNNQDFKKMGIYYKYLPFECFSIFICLLNLGGLPLTLGFLIKHLLFIGLEINSIFNLLIFLNCTLAAITGLFYSYRLFYNVFFDFKKAKKTLYLTANQNNLNSIFYSNSSLSGLISIIGLVIFSYLTGLYLFFIFLHKSTFFSELGNIYIYSSYIDYNWSNKNFLFYISYLNWFIIFLFIIILLTSWRKIEFFYNIKYFLISIILIVIFKFII